MAHAVLRVLLIFVLLWPDHASREEVAEERLWVGSDWDQANEREFKVQIELLEDVILKLEEGDPDKETAKLLLTKLQNREATKQERVDIYRLREKAQIEAAKQLLQRMPIELRHYLFRETEWSLAEVTNKPDEIFHKILRHIQQTERMSNTPDLLLWMKCKVINEAQKKDSSRLGLHNLRDATIAFIDQVFEDILASEVKAKVQAEFTSAKDVWDRRILPYLNLNEEDWGQPAEQWDTKNQLRSIFSQNDPKALTEDQKKWFDQAEFNAQKEVWDTTIWPYLVDADEAGGLEPAFYLTMSQLSEIFDWSHRKLTEEQTWWLDDREMDAATYLLSTKLEHAEGAQDLKERIKFTLKADDRKSLEKIEVEAALEKFLKDDIKNLRTKKKTSEGNQQLSRGYIEAAIEYLTSLGQAKSIDELQIQQWSMWTDKQVKSIAHVMHLASAEATDARELLRHYLRDIDGAEELGNEIKNTDYLSSSQRQRLDNLLKTEVTHVQELLRSNLRDFESAGKLLTEIESSGKLTALQRHRLQVMMTAQQVMMTAQELKAKREKKKAEGERREQQKEVYDAVELLLDLDQQVPGARDLLNEIKDASKLTDDEKQRLKAMKTRTRNSANKVHLTMLSHIVLLWIAAH